jgi:hypothetical protein
MGIKFNTHYFWNYIAAIFRVTTDNSTLLQVVQEKNINAPVKNIFKIY